MLPPRLARDLSKVGLALLAISIMFVIAMAIKPAEAPAMGRVVADVETDATKLDVSVRAPRDSRKVTFFVDGNKRWTDRSPKWQLGRRGYLSANGLQPGRHRVATEISLRGGGVKRAARIAFLSPAGDTDGGRWSLKRPKHAQTGGTTQQPAPVDAGFDRGWSGWNMDGVGDVEPTIATDIVDSGSASGKVVLKGSQDRSELILDGSGSPMGPGTITFTEGDEYFYGFSFFVKQMQYGGPGAHNLITQFKSDGDESPAFGLQLWDFEGEKGLWSHGEAMKGDHFLAPVSHNAWHDVVIHFEASRKDRGAYEVFFDGELVDSGDDVSMILPHRELAYLKTGLYRNGGQIPGTSEMRIDSVRLGNSMAQVTGS